MKRLMPIAIVALVAVLGLAGCGGPKLPSEPPAIRGEITSVTPAADGSGVTVLIEGAVEADTSYDKASVRVTSEADVWLVGADGSVEAIAPEDLGVGLRVEAWFTGPVAESYPVQATASAIAIIQ